jgi:hypothetical protein
MVLNNAHHIAAAVAFTLVLSGCGRGYRLQKEASMAVVAPPIKPAATGGPTPALRIRLHNARSNQTDAAAHCDIDNDLINIHWHGRTADVQLKPEQYFALSSVERTNEIGPRVYLDAEQHLEQFQEALLNREAIGCLDNGRQIKQSIAERFPFPPALSFFIRFGDYTTSGFIDLTSDFHLKVVSPTYSRLDRNVISGYQITYYAITPESRDARVRISLAQETSSPPLIFSKSFRLYRLMFRASQASGSRLATLLSADDAPGLQIATRQLQASPGNSCMSVFAPGVTCLAPHPHVAVNPEFAIRVNEKETYVSPGATVADVIRFSRRFPVSRKLQIRRVFRGRTVPLRFDRATGDIRKLMLMPGDEISNTEGA